METLTSYHQNVVATLCVACNGIILLVEDVFVWRCESVTTTRIACDGSRACRLNIAAANTYAKAYHHCFNLNVKLFLFFTTSSSTSPLKRSAKKVLAAHHALQT